MQENYKISFFVCDRMIQSSNKLNGNSNTLENEINEFIIGSCFDRVSIYLYFVFDSENICV